MLLNKISRNYFKPIYRKDSVIFNNLIYEINNYSDYVYKSKKNDKHSKLEKLGLTASIGYDYYLNMNDEMFHKFNDIYKKKYKNVIFIPENVFLDLGYELVEKNEMCDNIPSHIVDFLVDIKIDVDDCKIYSRNNKYCDITYSECVKKIKNFWITGEYREEYLNLFHKGEETYCDYDTKYKLIKDFFFLKCYNGGISDEYEYKIDNKNKKTFKEFIKNDMTIEYLVLHPIRGGFLLLCNW
jgi:hypothetical protein